MVTDATAGPRVPASWPPPPGCPGGSPVGLGPVEQRYQSACEVLDGAAVVDVAPHDGVACQTVHEWLRRHATRGLQASP